MSSSPTSGSVTLYGPCGDFPMSGQSFGEEKPGFESEMSQRQQKLCSSSNRKMCFNLRLEAPASSNVDGFSISVSHVRVLLVNFNLTPHLWFWNHFWGSYGLLCVVFFWDWCALRNAQDDPTLNPNPRRKKSSKWAQIWVFGLVLSIKIVCQVSRGGLKKIG